MTDSRQPAGRQLSSWKEIAAHFDRDVRTVQRWEKDEGLPVHRHPHRSRHSVFAYTTELDDWWHGRPQVPVDAAAPVADSDTAADGARPRFSISTRVAIPAAVLALTVAVLLPLAAGRAPRDGGRLHALPLDAPYDMAAAGDVDGDGAIEIALSSSARGSTPRVYRFDAASRTLGAAVVDVVVEGAPFAYIYSVADVNGDRLADLVVSTMRADVAVDTSPSFLVFGRRSWPRRLTLPRDADVRIELPVPYDARLGSCRGAGSVDLNGDGVEDVLLSAPEFGPPGRQSAGALFMLAGRRTWPAHITLPDAADFEMMGSRSGEGLGMACAAGDWDADGRADLAVHAGEHTLWSMRKRQGRTYLIGNGKSWPRLVDAATDFLLRVDNPYVGTTPADIALADVNGDGHADLLRSSPVANGPADRADAVRVWFGGRHTGVLTGTDEDVMIRFPREAIDRRLIVHADVDEDGAEDVALTDADGAVWLLPGRATWPREGQLNTLGTRLATVTAMHGESLSLIDAGPGGLVDLLFPRVPAAEGAQPWLGVVALHDRLPFEVRPDANRKVVIVPGPVVVRIPGSATDPQQLDTASLRLNGAAPRHVRTNDDDGDGRMDVQLYYETAEMVFDSGPVVRLVGRRRDGRLVGGTQPIELVRRTLFH